MTIGLLGRIAVSLSALTFAGTALAQATGAEIIGQPLTVTTNGVTNTIYLDPGGTARLVTPGGSVVSGTWAIANGQLCLSNGIAQECWPYAAPFQAGQAVTLTSSCNATSTWLASSTNGPAAPAGQKGERGR